MKKITLLACVLSGSMAFSQIGINTSSPNSTLDVAAKVTDGSKPEGLTAPRLTGDQIKAGDALYGANQRGNIIYATAAVGTPSAKTVNIDSAGYYFFNGSVWQKIVTTDTNTNIYSNNGTLSANRIVAMDDKTLSFSSTATTGTSHFNVDGNTLNVDAVNDRIGIGVLVPTTKLDVRSPGVAGALRIADGTQAEGRVLTSDAGGIATWRDAVDTNTNIYTNNGTLSANRIVTMADNTLTFTSAATAQGSHFRVDGTTFNIDAFNNRVGIGTIGPTTPLHVSSADAGAVRITDGTQGEGKFLVSDATGVATWRNTTGVATVMNATAGDVFAIGTTLSRTDAVVTIDTPGYYIVSPRVILDKLPAPSPAEPRSCTGFVAYNLSKTPVAVTDPAFTPQDIHIPAGPGASDFIYTSNITHLDAGNYYLMIRYGSGSVPCTSVTARPGQNTFSVTLLK